MIVIEGGTVLTVDDADHVYAPGHVVLEADRITAVGPGRYPGPADVGSASTPIWSTRPTAARSTRRSWTAGC